MTQATPIAVLTEVETDWESVVERAYARRARHLWDFARRLGQSPAIAEEIAQEAFVRLLDVPSHRRPENVDAWLFRVVHNLAMDGHRRGRQATVTEIAPVADPAADLERRAVWDHVAALPPRQRAAVFLRFRADLEYADIAAVLGITEAGVRANVFRAMSTLRERMVER